ncbi:MAG: ferritin-like domain-containing protein [Acidimicrobiales bacterium]
MTQETQNPMTSEPSALDQLSTSAFSRRKFLVGSGVVAGLAVVTAACGSDDDTDTATTDTTEAGGTDTTAAAGGGDDLAVAAFAAGLEVLAVGTYKAALDAAVAGKLGAVPDAGAEFVKTAMGHHEEHLAAWNKVLKGAGKPEVSTPDAKLKPTVDGEFAKVKDFGGAATLARTLEEIAAATYLSAIPTLKSKDAIKLAASIQAIDAKHVAILNYVLGVYPVPDVFAKTDKAAKPA